MCGLCPDVIGGCDKEECGALPRIDENGNPRSRYFRWYCLGEIPCEHELAGHADPTCQVRQGYHCTCWDEDE